MGKPRLIQLPGPSHSAMGAATYLTSEGICPMNSADYIADNPYARFGDLAVNATEDSRRTFIRKTYIHLMLAVYAFIAFEWLFFAMGLEVPALRFIATMPMGWLLVMGAFFLVSVV